MILYILNSGKFGNIYEKKNPINFDGCNAINAQFGVIFHKWMMIASSLKKTAYKIDD